MIVGIGTDIVGVRRFAQVLKRTPAFADRVFHPGERLGSDGKSRRAESLAVRFAAKEAAAKVLGVPPGCGFLDCEVVRGEGGRPELVITGMLGKAAEAAGVRAWHVSLTHDEDIAAAIVVAES